MPSFYKCTACEASRSFATRAEALTAGWMFIDVLTATATRYHVLCPRHLGISWVRKAINPDAPAGKAEA